MARNTAPAKRSRLAAILRLRCPRCLEGLVFQRLLVSHLACPVCGLRFGREDGYYVGAMYISYAMSVPILCALVILLWLRLSPPWSLFQVFLLSLLLFLPAVPAIVRYSRVMWLHLDWLVDPVPPERARDN
jgi:uncharacterized protein (DUF983 family)